MPIDLDRLVSQIRDRSPRQKAAEYRCWHAGHSRPAEGDPASLYHNSNPELGINFRVERLPLLGLQAMDPRLVWIAPEARNECHRHAHESIFVVLSGQGELLIDSEPLPLRTGAVACVPRWVVHQSRNTSPQEDLLLLAITDFGLTSAVLGDYDQRTRMKRGGVDAFATPRPNSTETP